MNKQSFTEDRATTAPLLAASASERAQPRSLALAASGRWLAGLLVGVLAASGCGSKTGTVTGAVRYRNQMLTTGTVSFYCEKGEIVSALIAKDGTYRLAKVPKGSARVAV